MKNEAVKQSPRQKINRWIDNSLFMHWFMFIGSLNLGAIILQSKHYLAFAFCVGASILFLPPLQKNIKLVMGHIERKYFMNMGIIMLIIAMFAQARP